MISIREADPADIGLLYGLYNTIGKKDDGYFEHAFNHGITILIASFDDEEAGFCLLNWKPRYSLYKRLHIPEIQDLNVVQDHRRKGIAGALIKWCEGLARAKGAEMMGISYGLTKDYGPAQILYTKLGYVPDGLGVTYDREPVSHAKAYPIDDNLSLMLIKPL